MDTTVMDTTVMTVIYLVRLNIISATEISKWPKKFLIALEIIMQSGTI